MRTVLIYIPQLKSRPNPPGLIFHFNRGSQNAPTLQWLRTQLPASVQISPYSRDGFKLLPAIPGGVSWNQMLAVLKGLASRYGWRVRSSDAPPYSVERRITNPMED